MRADHNLRKFCGHPEWYTHELGHMFIPTEECPDNAKKAMDEYNSYTFPEEYKKSKMKKHD
ncbi:hypothetical protein [Absicoccus porci]|jgi:hypothetical protein|uniref:hypothetical protein n=1 Tax=Absicoccus porci TaxID=2486576 RepID=UPI003D8D9C62